MVKSKTLSSPRRAAFRCHDPGRSGIRSDTGVTLIEVLIATVILVVGLVAGAQLLALSIQIASAGR